jgi:hypothetical protein
VVPQVSPPVQAPAPAPAQSEASPACKRQRGAQDPVVPPPLAGVEVSAMDVGGGGGGGGGGGCGDAAPFVEATSSSSSNTTNGSSSSIINGASEAEIGLCDVASSDLLPYPAEGQLEYLDDCFQMIVLMIKGNAARMKDDMKKEGTTSRYSSYESSGDQKHSRRELAAKLKLQESRIQVRLQKTSLAGNPLPRLEVMNQRFHLDSFEKKIILLLIGSFVHIMSCFCGCMLVDIILFSFCLFVMQAKQCLPL